MKKQDAVSNFHWIEIKYKEDEEGELSPCFDYRDSTYFLNDCMRFNYTNPTYDGYWDAYIPTYFNGIVIKLSDDGDAVQVGRS